MVMELAVSAVLLEVHAVRTRSAEVNVRCNDNSCYSPALLIYMTKVDI